MKLPWRGGARNWKAAGNLDAGVVAPAWLGRAALHPSPPPIPAGCLRPRPSPVHPPPLPKLGQVLVRGGRGQQEEERVPEAVQEESARRRTGCPSETGRPPAPATAPPAMKALRGAAQGRKRTCLWLFSGCLSSLGDGRSPNDVRMEGQSRAGLGDPGQDTHIRADQPGKGAASQLLPGEAPPSL